MKNLKILFLLFTLLNVLFSQQCDLQDPQKLDCGFMGIDQSKCEAKGCCWKPAFDFKQTNDNTPWCFYPSGQNPCEKIDFDGSKGPGFDSDFYDKMYALFEVNINIQGKGGIVAAPDHSTPGGSYYYHWMRDAALTMRTFMQLNDFKLEKVEQKMKAYVGWVQKVQNETDPNGNDIRINPKFELPNGQVYVGGWCRPQTDGPGLRSAALIMFANILLDAGQTDYVNSALLPSIKFDLEWVHSNWQSDGCDLWEEVRSNDFFFNRNAFYYALDEASKLFTRVGDSAQASKCDSTKSSVKASLDGHWTGTFMTESSNRQKDSAVIHSFSSFGAYSFTDDKVAKTISTLALTFCIEYPLNQQDNKNAIPGVLMGRYPGDSYAGGNPWQLLTAVLAKTFYQGASALSQNNGFEEEQDQRAWSQLLNIAHDSSVEEFIRAQVSAGDAVMYRMYQHVKSDGGHISEQISKQSGSQISAQDLTWSYANLLSAMQARGNAVELLSKRVQIQEE